MEKFRLIHISDLHLSVREGWFNALSRKGNRLGWALRNLYKGKNIFYPSSFDSSLIQAVTSHLQKISDEIDALIISGDLATTGRDDDLNVAINSLNGQFPSSWGAFPRQAGILSMDFPTIIIPGNHDRYKVTTGLPGNYRFESIFGKYWDAGQGISSSEFGGNYVRSTVLRKGQETLIICCADFTLYGESDADVSAFSYLGQGVVHSDRLGELQSETQALIGNSDYSDAAVIWVVHFPPYFKGLDPKLVLRLDERLINAAKAEGVTCILAGHTHNQRCYSVDGVRIYCAGTVCSVDLEYPGRNAFLDLEFEINEGHLVDIVAYDLEYRDDTEDRFVCQGKCLEEGD